jgi:hypothetical protein
MNRRRFSSTALALAGALLAAAGVRAADKIVTLDPAEAGPDFAVQGEYTGKAGHQKLGAQVIALGNGTFRAVFLPGGLPGAGWDGKTRISIDGRSEGSETHFGAADTGWRGTIAEGRFRGMTDEGGRFKLKRVAHKSPTLGKRAPRGATVLFDGTNADAWNNGKVENGELVQGASTKIMPRDFTLHVEFRTSYMPSDRGQGRSNSGVFLDGRYEIQVLDSFGLKEESHECGSIYSIKPEEPNMTYPPLSWQTYDLDFTAPIFDSSGRKTKNAVVTLRHNGVLVHDHVEIPRGTAGGQEGPTLGPIEVMNHGNPVRYRNIWIIEHQ